MPKSQIELATAPARTVGDAIAELAAGRRALAEAGIARFAGAGAHPLAAPLGELNQGERYDSILAEYGVMAEAQLVCSLQVHVPVARAHAGGLQRAARIPPELAALAANAPFYAGRDTGLASVRPMIATLLPRQGIPPILESWEHFEATVRWGKTSGTVAEPGRWWYELRPHLTYGTLEVRVCDSQATIADSAARGRLRARAGGVAVRARGPRCAGRVVADRREPLGGVPLRRRGGVRGPRDRRRAPVREILRQRLEELAPVAARIGAEPVRRRGADRGNGALRQREVGLEGAAGWLADRFLA